MNVVEILNNYTVFIEKTLQNRFFKHKTVIELLNNLPDDFLVSKLGVSVEGRSVNQVSWGAGPVKILMWSQMHGDEPTGTMALFDLFNFLKQPQYHALSEMIKTACTLYMIPMANPDGAEIFTRRNSQQIDINRDYLAANTPEGEILKSARTALNPGYGFNLHDQNTLWSVKGSNKPATLSFLAPATEPTLTTHTVRENAKLVIADMFKEIHPLIEGHIGLFDETYEIRAFGDNFQKAGMSTILIEAGGLSADHEKQEIRKYFFLSLLSGICSIASNNFKQQQVENYEAIPPNDKNLYHLIFHNVSVNGLNCSVSLNYLDEVNSEFTAIEKIWYIHEIGDLTGWDAYTVYNENYEITSKLIVDKKADFDVMQSGELILSFKNGILVHSTSKTN